MFETKVEWEACVGENRLQFSIFSSFAAVVRTKKLCWSRWDSNTERSHISFFAGGIKACILEVPLIIAHSLIFSK